MNADMGRSPTLPHRDQVFLIGAFVFTAATIYICPLFLPTPLLEPDEGLHATISQEMVEHREWIVPRFRDETFPDKPILYFWAQMASLLVFGMNETGVRFPGLMFSLLGALSTGLLGGRLFGARTGFFAALILMTMVIPMSSAQSAAHDVALVPWTTLTMLCLWESEQAVSRGHKVRWLVGAICMIALAILTKALIGVALVAIGFGSYLAIDRRLNWGSTGRFVTAMVGGMILASPWYLAMEMRNPGYLYYYFIERHLLGFATTSQQHGHEPWHYYVPIFVLGAMPWGWYIPLLLRDEWVKSRSARTPSALVLLLCWMVAGVMFLSIAGSKLVTYALPLFPVLAILSGLAWRNRAESQLSSWAVRWFAGTVRLAAVVGVVVPFLILLGCRSLYDTQWSLTVWLTSMITAVVAVAGWLAFRRQRYDWNVGLIAAWTGCIAFLVMSGPLQVIAEEFSERSLAQWINARGKLPEGLVMVGAKPASVIFYLRDDLRRQLKNDQFRFTNLNQLSSTEDLIDGTIVAVTKTALTRANAEQRTIPGAARHTVGQFVLFEHKKDSHPSIHTALIVDQ